MNIDLLWKTRNFNVDMANATVSCPTTSVILFDPLQCDSNRNALNSFLNIVKTSIGHRGKLKIIQNVAGGHATVTTVSERLFHNLSVKNSLLKFIIASAKTHLKCYGDGGLFLTLLVLKLLNNSLSLSYPLPLIGRLYEHFGRIFLKYLNLETNACIIDLNLSNLVCLQSVVLTILQSKPGCILSEKNRNHISLLLLKAFLNIIPCSKSVAVSSRFNLSFVTLVGLNGTHSKLYEGLLIKKYEASQKAFKRLETKSLKSILFTTSLAGDMEFPVETIEVDNSTTFWETVLKFLEGIISKVIALKVDIVACQKVIHPVLKKQLEDANILVLERLGYEAAKHFEFISDSSGVSSLSLEISDDSCGSITSVNEILIGKNNFLLLSNENKPFWTMLICSYNEMSLNETKVVCKQAVAALFRLLQKPKVFFGAGCGDVYTCTVVEEKVKEHINDIKTETGCTSMQILEALCAFRQSIIEVMMALHQGSSLEFVTENVYGHLWKTHDGNFPTGDTKCLCGQRYAKFVDLSSWSFLTKSFTNSLTVLDEMLPESNETKSVILDELSCKINAYTVAFETASLLLRTSLCISNLM